MPMKRKKFIDKKKSVTFRLVHRSQKDPLAADETAPQHVLLEYEVAEKKKRKDEEHKYGIYYDDDYNYLQHLRDVNTVPEWEPVIEKQRIQSGPSDEQTKSSPKEVLNLNLPSSVFQSCVEESEGLLNKAAPTTGPRPDWDPDIVAALDDDFNFDNSENELEDDFMALANPQSSDQDEDSYTNDEESDEEGSECSFGSEDHKTGFTNYSMSSSILPRSENLQNIDDHFEKFFEKYDDDEIGALDCEEIQGHIKPDSELIQQLAQDYADSQDKGTLKELILSRSEQNTLDQNESSDEEFMEITITEKQKEKWDCDSIISTYSTTSNRPKLISEPKGSKIELSGKSGLPKDTLRVKGLTRQLLKKLDEASSPNVSKGKESVNSKITVATSIRLKNETPEEKKERKTVVKQIRRERRAEKKANKLAFKEEEKRQEKIVHNLRQNMQGIKLL